MHRSLWLILPLLLLALSCSDEPPSPPPTTNVTDTGTNADPADAQNNATNNTDEPDTPPENNNPPEDTAPDTPEDTSDPEDTAPDVPDTSDTNPDPPEDTTQDTADATDDVGLDTADATDDTGEPDPTNPRIVFVFDQDLDALFRLEDRNGDGDMNDLGEITRFFDDGPAETGISNSQGMYPLGPDTLLATDNFEPANIIWLEDLNGDGDALDEGESRVWFDGSLPEGHTMMQPVCLTRGPDGAFYVVDNNTLNPSVNPEALYRLEDTNDDGVIGDGEVERVAVFSPVAESSMASIFDVEFDAAGLPHVINTQNPDDIDRVLRVEGDQINVFMGGDDLFRLTELGEGLALSTGRPEMTRLPETDELVLLVTNLARTPHFIAVRDVDASGRIDLAREIRVLWDAELDTSGLSFGTPLEFKVSPDGSMVWTDALSDQIIQVIDHDLDGDFNDEGELEVLYDADTAEAVGNEAVRAGRAMTVYFRE